MTRFYFDHQEKDGEIRRDEEGTELPDVAAARVEAVRAAAEWIKDHVSESGTELRLVTRNDDLVPLFIVKESIEISPMATRKPSRKPSG
jgi:hypothetical protein